MEDWFGASVPPSAAGPHDGSMHDFRHLLGPGCDSSKDGSSAPPGMFNPPQPPLPSLTQQWGEHRQHHHHHHHHHHRGAGGLAPPRPPPSSTPMVAMTAPPAQLQMPLMSLQPRMNATEAMAALSAANCDVVKKVGGPGGLLRGRSEIAVRRSLSGLDRFPLRLSLLQTVVTVAILLAV